MKYSDFLEYKKGLDLVAKYEVGTGLPLGAVFIEDTICSNMKGEKVRACIFEWIDRKGQSTTRRAIFDYLNNAWVYLSDTC